MNLRPCLFLAALLPLAACAQQLRSIPHSATAVEQSEPLPADIKPLTVEQEEEVGGAT
jgi:hypothetical protein